MSMTDFMMEKHRRKIVLKGKILLPNRTTKAEDPILKSQFLSWVPVEKYQTLHRPKNKN